MNKRGPNDEIEDEVKKRTRDSLISVEESELYDRQIRVWGIEVQEILRNSRILVVGMNGINCEVLKNLTLIGIGHVTLVDSSIVQEKDLNLFLSTNDIGSFKVDIVAQKLRELNPRVDIATFSDTLDNVMGHCNGEKFLAKFDIISLSDAGLFTMERINSMCRKVKLKYYASNSYGVIGYIFVDLNNHEFIIESRNSNTAVQKKTDSWVSFEDAFMLKQRCLGKSNRQLKRELSPTFIAIQAILKFQRRFGKIPNLDILLEKANFVHIAKNVLKELGVPPEYCVVDDLTEYVIKHDPNFDSALDQELAPVCAVVGGVLAQDIVRVLSGKGAPLKNLFCVNGIDLSGSVTWLD